MTATSRIYGARLTVGCLLALSVQASCGGESDTADCVVDIDCETGDACRIGSCSTDGMCEYRSLSCDDQQFCNGIETCSPTLGCRPGMPPEVDDGVDCTIDQCDEENDVITHVDDDSDCDDGLYCNGTETCDRVLGCRAGTPPDADDGVACTVASCDEDADIIVFAPDAARCDDGLYCNGAEICDPRSGCVAGDAPVLDDRISCTTDTCDEDLDAIVHLPNDSQCDDGDSCTLNFHCDLALDCVYEVQPDASCGTCDNCGFESGDFTDWTTRDIAMPFDAMRVEMLGGGGGNGFFWTVVPTEGAYAAYHGFDGSGPGTIEIGQDIRIHSHADGATLSFDYRAGWDTTFGATIARTFEVHIEPAGGGVPLQTTVVASAAAGETTVDTGTQTGAVDVSAFAGQTVYVRFVWDVPESNAGPGVFQLDDIAITDVSSTLRLMR